MSITQADLQELIGFANNPAISPEVQESLREIIYKLEEEINELEDVATIPVEIESAGEGITIPANSTLAEALQIIVDAIDPEA